MASSKDKSKKRKKKKLFDTIEIPEYKKSATEPITSFYSRRMVRGF